MRRMPGRASTGMRRSSPTGGRRTCWRRDSGRPAGSAAHSCGSTARSLSSTGYPVQVASCARCRHHRPMRGVSIELLPDPPAAEVLSATCAADELGLHTAFLADEIYHRDAWMILAAAAQRTTRIRLAPGVAHVTLRDPLLAAQQLATLDELTGGRAAAAFSVGNLAMLEQFGFDPAELHVASRLREAHTAMRSLVDSGQAEMDGTFHRYYGVFTNARAVSDRVPLLLGAMGGPLTFRLAGEIADGVYAACSFSPEALDYLVSNVRRGADQAGRDWRTVELAASLTCTVSDAGSPPGPPRAQRPRSICPRCRGSWWSGMASPTPRSSRSARRLRAATWPRRYDAGRTSWPTGSASPVHPRTSSTGSGPTCFQAASTMSSSR